MPIIIHRPDFEPPREAYAYDKIVGVIMLVLVGLWIAGDLFALVLMGSLEGLLSKAGADLKTSDLRALNTQLALLVVGTVASGALFVVSAIGIRNSLRYGFWLAFPAGVVMMVTSGLPTEERTFAQWVFALVAMGYSGWRLIGWAGPKPN
jgi:hypothetical protein